MTAPPALATTGSEDGPLRRGGRAAPSPRTLVDIFRETVAAAPDALAVDNGAEVLTYAEFAEAADEVADVAERHRASGAATGSASAITSGTVDLYVAIMGILLAGACLRPGRRRRPRRAGPARLRRGARCAAVVGNELVIVVRGRRGPGARVRRQPEPEDDAWVIFTSGSTGTPEGRRGHAPLGRGLRRRRGPAVPAGRTRSAPATG